MNRYSDKPPRSKREKAGFYTALSVCVIAVGMAAYSTYTSLSGYFDSEPEETVAVERVVTGVTETEAEKTTVTETQTESEKPSTAATETTEAPEEETETTPKETKTALETMLSVKTSLSFPLDNAKVIQEYSEDSVYNKTLNQWSAHTGVDFACTFIGTGCGTDEFHVDTQFIEQTFVEHHFGTHSTEIDDSGGVDGYPVGGCGEVVLWLREGFAIGDNGFVAAGTEVLYGFQ